jgi:hypothetical protein
MIPFLAVASALTLYLDRAQAASLLLARLHALRSSRQNIGPLCVKALISERQ